jgi:predicted NBD/HSP70 family sugar kinase
MKEINVVHGDTARALLRIVSAAQPISRVDLARRLQVTRGAITEIVKPLLTAGVLCEAAPNGGGRVGRPPVGLSFHSNGPFFIGVNIGVRRSQVGLATPDGRLQHEESFDTPADRAAAFSLICATIRRVCALVPNRLPAAIGVSAPGPTDADRTRLLFAPHLGWRDVKVAKELAITQGRGKKHLPGETPVIVENDATAAAMYEVRHRLQAASDGRRNDFILVRVGTGIGVGLVLGGEVSRGTGRDGGLLGEFGHMTIVAGGKLCPCGNRGCWERYASASSAAMLYAGDRPKVRGGAPLRFLEIVARAESGEVRALRTLEQIGGYLGVGISNVISGLGVSSVVVNGRIVFGWKFIGQPLRSAVAGTMAGRLANWSVEPGEPTGSGLGGAIEVATDHYLTKLAGRTT